MNDVNIKACLPLSMQALNLLSRTVKLAPRSDQYSSALLVDVLYCER